MTKNNTIDDYTQFEEALDDLIIAKLDKCESLQQWNNEIVSYFKNWTNKNNEIFEDVFLATVVSAISQEIIKLPLRNDYYRKEFLDWFPKSI